jgi:hypothetical protein
MSFRNSRNLRCGKSTVRELEASADEAIIHFSFILDDLQKFASY